MAGKVSIIGAGSVGSAALFALGLEGTPDEVVLLDRNAAKAKGEVMDLQHAATFIPSTRFKGTGNYRDIRGSDIVVITAGAPQKPGETRLDLVAKNRAILKSILAEVKKNAPRCILLIVTNPVDVLTYFAQKDTGFPARRVIGTGTVLDSARFRSFLAEHFKVSAHNVEAYVLGEHGDSSFPVLSTATVDSIPLVSMPRYKKSEMIALHKKTATVVYDVIKKKGATNTAIAVGICELVRTILSDEHGIFPVSTVLNGEYGIKNCAISTPSVLGRTGVIREIELPLNADEKKALNASVKVLKKVIASQK